jgi:hypothetical protein
MGFLREEDKKQYEGRFLKFEEGVARKLQLVSIKTVVKKIKGEEKEMNEITCKDYVTGEEKSFNPNRNFMKALAKVDGQLTPGSIIEVIPRKETFMNKENVEVEVLNFNITPLTDIEASF